MIDLALRGKLPSNKPFDWLVGLVSVLPFCWSMFLFDGFSSVNTSYLVLTPLLYSSFCLFLGYWAVSIAFQAKKEALKLGRKLIKSWALTRLDLIVCQALYRRNSGAISR